MLDKQNDSKMKELLSRLFDHQTLPKGKAFEVLRKIGEGEVNHSQIAAFLTVFQLRSITVEELTGFRDALLQLCNAVDLSEFDPIDLCGTGGDGKDTFNISTLASFVTAGAGVNVAKHGNYGVSSACGSSNVMEHLGYTFTNDHDTLKRQLENAGICFLHAPLFHPAMRHVGPVRRELGVKTFFNMLGPMVNPSKPKKQMVGVFSLELARLYNYMYQLDDKEYVILHALDGYDEISLTGPSKVISRSGENIIEPHELGLEKLKAKDIHGGTTVPEAAEIFMSVLNNKCTDAQRKVVCANAGVAIACARSEMAYREGVAMAAESLESGRALNSFQKLIAS